MELATPETFFNMLRFSQETSMAVLRTQERFFGGMLDLVSGQTAWLAPRPPETGADLPEAEYAGSGCAEEEDVLEEITAPLEHAIATVPEVMAAMVADTAAIAEATLPEAPAAKPKSSTLKTTTPKSKRTK